MDRNKKNDVKFGKFLAVGMAVAVIWGVLLLIVGLYVRFKFGSVLDGLMGNLDEVVKVKSAQNSQGQNIVPVSANISDDLTVGSWPEVLSSLVIVIALLTILFACLGIYGGLRHSKFILYMTIVFLLIAALFLVGLTSISNDSSSAFHEDAKTELALLIKDKYKIETTDDVFILALNRIMLWFECCGIRSFAEFTNLTFSEIGPDGTTKLLFVVPPACCVRSFFNSETTGVTPYDKLKECAINGNSVKGNIHTKGCYETVFNSVSIPVMVVLILMLIWDALVLILVILTIMEIRPEEDGRESVPEVRKEEAEEVPPVKKFVPYAKISSFIHPDLSRIKSTEIW